MSTVLERAPEERRAGRRRSPASGVAAGVALAGLSGLLATWAFPPYGAWPLIFVAWVPMVVAQHWFLSGRWSGLGPGIGIGGFYAGYLHGLIDPSFAWWVSVIPFLIAAAVAVAARDERRFQEASGYARFVVTFPLVWVAVDFLRGFAPGIGTRGYPAYALFGEPWFLQPVSVFSVHALDLLILVVNWTVAAAILAWLGRRAGHVAGMSRRTLRVSVAAVLAVLLGWGGLSLTLYGSPPRTLPVAAIQPGTAVHDTAELAREVAQTRQAAAGGARLIVWREKALAFDPRRSDTTLFTDLARQTGAYLAIGYQVLTPRGQRNEATVIAPDGRFLGVYGKQHPAIVFADDQTSLTKGTLPVYHTAIGRLGTIICFDLDYTDTARTAARHGAQIVAVPSWDPPGDATKHYGLLVFRAIENRLTMVKTDAAHDSVIIDPYGRILARSITPRASAAIVMAAVPVGSGQSPWVNYGDLFGWALVAAALITVAFNTRRAMARNPQP